jgi:Tol biopolymer transport system component
LRDRSVDHVELVTIRRNGSGRQVLGSWSWRRDGAEPTTTPTWSPEGTRIAFALRLRGGGSRLFVINSDGTGLRALTPRALNRRGPARPAWGRFGTIAFDMKRPDGARELYVIRADGTSLRRLTHSGRRSGAWAPAWSDSRDRLAFARRDPVGRQSDIWIVNADGSRPRRVAKTPENESEPAWFGG